MGHKRKGVKKSRHRASVVKLSNKRLNRLVKQGKLKKAKGAEKKKLLAAIKKRVQPQSQEHDVVQQEAKDIPLEEADYEYFARPGRDFSFLTQSTSLKNKPKQKRKKSDDLSIEEQYEQLPRKRFGVDKQYRQLLPLKSREKGLIVRYEEMDDENGEQKMEQETEAMEASGPEKNDEEPTEELPPLSTAEILIRRKIRLSEKKQKLAMLASDIIEQPQESIGKLKQIRQYLEETDPDVFFSVRKLAMVFLLEVFKDIIPGYRIRLPTAEEKAQAAKKETIQLRKFEESLLNNYKQYLKYLDYAVKGKIEGKIFTRSKKDSTKGTLMTEKAKGDLQHLAVRCLCELLVMHPHFNYRTNIIQVVIPFVTHKNKKLSDLVCGYVKQLFREDKSGEVTLEVVRLIGRIIKAKQFSVKPKLLELFLSLKIKEVNKGDGEIENKATRRERIKQMSRRERKRYKQLKELERELGEASAEEKRKYKLKLHTEIISLVFLTYFRILKKAPHSILLSAVLEGLAKFAHLINVDFFDDLFTVLNELVNSGELTYRESLHCVQTAFTILSGQGAALNIDPISFYRHLYCTLLQLHAGVSSKDVPIVLTCMDVMINKRKKQVSVARVLAYFKRLTTLSLQLETHGVIGALATVRGFMHAFSKTDLLLDTEYEGSGTFMPELDDPEHCNAHNTALYELVLLRRHFHPVVRQFAAHILAGAPSSGTNALPAELAYKSPAQLYSEFDPSEMVFNPPVSKPRKTGVKRNKIPKIRDAFCQEEMRKLKSETENAIKDLDLDFSQLYHGEEE